MAHTNQNPPRSYKRAAIGVVIFAALHFIATAAAFFVAFTIGMRRFDFGGPPSVLEEVAAAAFSVLSFPAYQFATAAGIHNDAAEWLLVYANSLLWGLALYALFLVVWRLIRPRVATSIFRFSLGQMLIGVAILSICVAALALTASRKHRNMIQDAYGSPETYALLCQIQSADVFTAWQTGTPRNAVDEDVLKDVHESPCGHMPADRFTELWTILTTPSNFVHDFTKDFVFQPTYSLHARTPEKQFDLYFDFQNKEAAIAVDGKVIQYLATDTVADRLKELLSTSCAHN